VRNTSEIGCRSLSVSNGRLLNSFGLEASERAARAGAVLDHHRLAEALLQLGRHGARDHVEAAARWERDHEGDRPGWIVVRDRLIAEHRRQAGERRRE
jgi:hypothetical protein